MKKQCFLRESVSTFFVRFSNNINNSINAIYSINQNNKEKLSEWLEYLDGLKTYISNPSIAFDYARRFIHYPNGAMRISELGYDVTFIVKMSKQTNEAYVYIFKMDLKPEEFGLKTPPLNESKTVKKRKIHHLKESQLRQIIREVIYRITA